MMTALLYLLATIGAVFLLAIIATVIAWFVRDRLREIDQQFAAQLRDQERD